MLYINICLSKYVLPPMKENKSQINIVMNMDDTDMIPYSPSKVQHKETKSKIIDIVDIHCHSITENYTLIPNSNHLISNGSFILSYASHFATASIIKDT